MPPVSAMLIMFMHLVPPSRHPSHDVDHHERRVERPLHFSQGLLHEHSFATDRLPSPQVPNPKGNLIANDVAKMFVDVDLPVDIIYRSNNLFNGLPGELEPETHHQALRQLLTIDFDRIECRGDIEVDNLERSYSDAEVIHFSTGEVLSIAYACAR